MSEGTAPQSGTTRPLQDRHHTATLGLSQGWMQLSGMFPSTPDKPRAHVTHRAVTRGNQPHCCPRKSAPVPFLTLPRVREEYNFHSAVLWLLSIYITTHTHTNTHLYVHIHRWFVHVCVYTHIHIHTCWTQLYDLKELRTQGQVL